LTKLYTMSLKSQLAAVRILAIENLNTCEFWWIEKSTYRIEKREKWKNFYILIYGIINLFLKE
jgi:hypothetical protein